MIKALLPNTVSIPCSPLTNCGILGKLLKLFKHSLFTCIMGTIKSCLVREGCCENSKGQSIWSTRLRQAANTLHCCYHVIWMIWLCWFQQKWAHKNGFTFRIRELPFFLSTIVPLVVTQRTWPHACVSIAHPSHFHISESRRCQHNPNGIYCFPSKENVRLEILKSLCPYHPERARSHLILEAKQGRAWLVLEWEKYWRLSFSGQDSSPVIFSSQ